MYGRSWVQFPSRTQDFFLCSSLHTYHFMIIYDSILLLVFILLLSYHFLLMMYEYCQKGIDAGLVIIITQ